MAEGSTIQDLFGAGWEVQRKIENGEFSSDDSKVQIVKGIETLEKATHQANELGLFSSNESVEEVTTADLKYLLLPALLGDLSLQLSDGDRLENISKARIYCVDYLQRCKSYAITTDDPPRKETTSSASAASAPVRKTLEQLSAERTAKIARLKAQKQLEKRLQELTELLKSCQDHRDEELVREHYLTLLKTWVYKCQDHVRSIDQEAEILEVMKQRGGQPAAAEAAPPPPRQPMKPVLITRDMIKNKVFGAGYPSVPTMTLEEFYQKEYEEQVEQHKREQAKAPKTRVPDDEEETEKMEEDENESEEALKKARDFDEFKDDHRRGWGNRKNMG